MVDVCRASRPVAEEIPLVAVDTLREVFGSRANPGELVYLVTFYYDGEPFSYPFTVAQLPTNDEAEALLAFERRAQRGFLRDVILNTEH